MEFICLFSLSSVASLFLHLHFMSFSLSSETCLFPPEPSHPSATMRLSALISAPAQTYSILTLHMAGEVMCDMEATALQSRDVVPSSPTRTLHTVSVIFVTCARACVLRPCSSLAAAAMATARAPSHMLPLA